MVSKEVERSVTPGTVTSLIPRGALNEIKMARGLLGTPDEVRAECDRVQAGLDMLYEMEPDQAMRFLNGISSRLTELERLLFRVENYERSYTRLRTMDVEPLLKEVDRQHKSHSRLLEARAQDLAIEGIRR